MGGTAYDGNNYRLMNSLDKQYQELLKTILEFGVEKKDRTGTGTKSIFGYTIRHNMKEGFPLLTTKKMFWKGIVTELIWFLRGDTNIKFLVDNNCHIWDGDAYKNYVKWWEESDDSSNLTEEQSSKWLKLIDGGLQWAPFSQEEFINKIKTDDEFAKKWGELGPVYGRQWRSWSKLELTEVGKELSEIWDGRTHTKLDFPIDQIANLISELKTNPDSRRLMVNAWNVGEIDQMVLPPCHYGFQVYTRELSTRERLVYWTLNSGDDIFPEGDINDKQLDKLNVPTRAISLMWNQRSVDTFLGLPFNIASYGLLLEIIAKSVNMVPDQLIGNLGDVHLYNNHIDQAKEQIGRKYAPEERTQMLKDAMGYEAYHKAVDELMPFGGGLSEYYDSYKIPVHTREPYPLPKLNINTEFWPCESGSCGEGLLDSIGIFKSFEDVNFCKCLIESDIQLSNYQHHPTIKAPLSN
jgi:thymidylate synthase